MSLPTLEQFSETARAEGFDEIIVREWAPDQVVDLHTHPFDVSALVVRGEFWLTVDGQTQHLGEGTSFRLARMISHAEKYGAQGATVWVARAN